MWSNINRISENCMNCGAVLNDDDNQNNILIDNLEKAQ